MKILKEIIDSIGCTEVHGRTDLHIISVEYDSRKCREGSLFVATVGENFDGHNFIEKAARNGAVAVICEYIPDQLLESGLTFIKSANSRRAMAEAAHCFYSYPTKKMKVYGITGTNGKTTISFLLDSIFREAGYKTGIIGTTGIFSAGRKIPATHTTPESIDLCGIFDTMLNENTEVVFMEVSSHALVQHRVDCIDFDAAVFTNLTHEHLDYHKTMEEYASAKNMLFKMLNENTFVVANGDDPYIKPVTDGTKARLLKVGRGETNNYRITDEHPALGYSSFSIASDGIDINGIKINLTGSYNIENAALSSVLALNAGISEEHIRTGLMKTKGAPGRMEQIALNNGAIGIVDYAHTPDALEKALKACRDVLDSNENQSKLISVFGCGGDRDKAKRPEMGKISTDIADISIITSDNPRTEAPEQIISDIKAGIKNSGSDFISIPDRKAAIIHAIELSQKGDIILVAGKGHEDYQIIGTEKSHFDDMEILGLYSK